MVELLYDVVIVGAGPIGCKVGELFAKNNVKVLILEEHLKIGEPVQCTGLVSHRIISLSGAPGTIVVNKVKKARFYSPSGNFLELKSKKPVYVIDRRKLDVELSKKTKKFGAEIKTSARFENYRIKDDFLEIKTTKGKFQSKLLIGADGPNSTVAKVSSIELPDDVVIGYQETIKDNFNPDTVELWFDSNISKNFFGWVVPENENYARVGIGCDSNPSKAFESFIKRRSNKKTISRNIVSGLIRRGLIKDSVSDRVLLVGDAACQVKPYSGGGLIYGLIGAKFAANACLSCLEKNRYDYDFLKKHYDEKWKKELSWPIKKGLFLNRLLHSLPSYLFNSSIIVANLFKPFLEEMDMDLID